MKKVNIFVVVFVVVVVAILNWAIIHDQNTIRNLKAENASLKSEITATRAAIDVASIFASDHNGVITTYAAALTAPLSPTNFTWVNMKGEGPVEALVIKVEPRKHDYPVREYIVGKNGDVNEVTLVDDKAISNHHGDWGTLSAWRR